MRQKGLVACELHPLAAAAMPLGALIQTLWGTQGQCLCVGLREGLVGQAATSGDVVLKHSIESALLAGALGSTMQMPEIVDSVLIQPIQDIR